MENSLKAISTLLIEATVVGICLIVSYAVIDYFYKKYIKFNVSQYVTLFTSVFILHIIYEYTGLNLWYSKEYCKLIKQQTV